ncbi:MAG: PD40 domain-containing protein [Deltaproteobacteria bacterium]|nr:PD40 domain-containing protein [Deltaproteobacteria bacterium]
MTGLRSLAHWILLLSCLLAAAPASSATNLIAYIDGEGDLYLIRPDGSGRRKLASGEVLQPVAFSGQLVKSGRDFYSWPVWSPDGNRLACFRVVAGEAENTDGLYIFDAASSQVLHAYQEPGLRPIYAYWAPNSQHLAVLLGGQGVFSLGLWPTAGSQRPKTVAQGAPFYFNWRADARAMLVHTGGDTEAKEGHSVSVLDVESGKRQMVSRAPAAFGPPSWSYDGKWLAYGDQAKEGEKATLMIAAADGSAPKSFGTVPEKIAMEWSPIQPLLAVATSAFVGDPLLEELRLIDVPSGKTRTVVKDNFAAYFWSPDGERILYAKRKLSTDLWAWAVVEVKDGKTYEVMDFVPSRPLLLVFQYFDQYALSHRLWSPDSKRFVFAGAVGADARPAEGLRNPTVYAVEAVKHATAKALSDGHIAFWSPQ